MRLGLIGGTDSKRTSGVYTPDDVVALQDAKNYVSRFSYDQVFNALSDAGTNAEGFDVSRDGRYVYVAVAANALTAAIYQYECTTPWDLSTISYSNKSLTTGVHDTNCNCVSISDDGTRLYFAGTTGDSVFSCTLSTPYDLSTAVVDVKAFYVGEQDGAPTTPFFGDSGTKMYVMGGSNDTVYQYTLSTAWDVSTASYANKSFSVTSQESAPQSVFFGDNGSRMYVVGTTNDRVYQYFLSKAWDVSTASYDNKSFSVSGQETNPRALFFKPDGTKMYVIGSSGDDVNEYDLSAAWDVSTASYVRVSATVGDTTPQGIWFKDDGTKMYIIGSGSDAVREFTLSTAWDVSTISFSKSLSVGFDTTPTGVTFKDDGTQLYVVGTFVNVVYQIELGTAWDIGTAKGVIFVGGSETTPRSVQISSDGSLLYVSGSSSDNIRKYTLSTAYELGTAALSESFAVSGLRTSWVTNNGLKIYVTTDSGSTNPSGGFQVRQINLTSPNNLSTATLSDELIPTYGLTGSPGNLRNVCLSPDGTRMFLVTNDAQGMYQFSLRFA